MNTTLELSELNQKIGQLFMIGLPSTDLDEDTTTLIRDYNPCGIILFSRNIQNPIQVVQLCQDIQETAIEYHNQPMFISVDQEGGRVARLTEPFTVFPGNTAIGQDVNPAEKAEAFGRITAKEMKMVGLNMDLAPVVDVGQDEVEKHLEGRTFGDDPNMVGLLGRAVIKALQDNGVMAVAKHFPGLGRAPLDPHEDLPRIELDADEIEKINLLPFQEAIHAGVSGIMTSHALYPILDSEWPGTLSTPILTDLLRNKMGFEGLIITDDLEMGAIAKQWGVDQGATFAFQAGADILLICEGQHHVLESLALIRKKILQNEIPLERLQQTNERILKAKSTFMINKPEINITEVQEYFHLTV